MEGAIVPGKTHWDEEFLYGIGVSLKKIPQKLDGLAPPAPSLNEQGNQFVVLGVPLATSILNPTGLVGLTVGLNVVVQPAWPTFPEPKLALNWLLGTLFWCTVTIPPPVVVVTNSLSIISISTDLAI